MLALCLLSLSCNYCSIIWLFFEPVRATLRDPVLDTLRDAVLATAAGGITTDEMTGGTETAGTAVTLGALPRAAFGFRCFFVAFLEMGAALGAAAGAGRTLAALSLRSALLT